MKQFIIPFILFPLLAMGFTSIPGFTASPLQKKPKTEDKLEKIMVLYLGSNYEKRKIVEDEITYYINDRGYEAQQSLKHFTDTDIPETDIIIEILEENGFDGILVIEVSDVNLRQERVNAKMTYGSGPGTPFIYDYFSVYRRYSEGYNRIETTFEILTSLFRLKDKSLIYSNTSKAYNKGDIELALQGFAKETARKLHSSKTLLRTK
jgi:hypothetical protein